MEPQTPDQPNQQVHYTRPLEPQAPAISDTLMRLHQESVRRFPELNLSAGEHVIFMLKRHVIGLIKIWVIVGIVMAALLTVIYVALTNSEFLGVSAQSSGSLGIDQVVAVICVLIGVLVMVGGVIATGIYNANDFFLTNESVIQHIQTTLFARKEQTVSLSNIEDASYTQHGIIPSLLGYGMIRLSTEGDETTYRFEYASSPKKQIAVLNNAVEAFKNGRPFTD